MVAGSRPPGSPRSLLSKIRNLLKNNSQENFEVGRRNNIKFLGYILGLYLLQEPVDFIYEFVQGVVFDRAAIVFGSKTVAAIWV